LSGARTCAASPSAHKPARHRLPTTASHLAPTSPAHTHTHTLGADHRKTLASAASATSSTRASARAPAACRPAPRSPTCPGATAPGEQATPCVHTGMRVGLSRCPAAAAPPHSTGTNRDGELLTPTTPVCGARSHLTSHHPCVPLMMSHTHARARPCRAPRQHIPLPAAPPRTQHRAQRHQRCRGAYACVRACVCACARACACVCANAR
jgi:hypothetical protein